MEFLKKLREAKGLTLYAAARLLGVSEPSYHHYEKRARGAQLEFLVRVKRSYKIGWAELGRMIEEEVDRDE